MRRSTLCFFALSVLGLKPVVADQPAEKTFSWPVVGTIKRSFDFPDARNALLELPILEVNSKPLYILSCRGRDLLDDPDFEYTGDFECRLRSLYSADLYSTLLTHNPMQERSWESRGRFISESLYGQCADYPEYGRVRHFRLRGMKLTLALSRITFERARRPGGQEESELLKSFHLEVAIEPDPGALSTIAEDVPFAEPPSLPLNGDVVHGYACAEIRRSHIKGEVTKEYIRKQGLEPPYPRIESVTREANLPGPNTEFLFANAPLPRPARGFYMPIRNDRSEIVYEFECSSTEPINKWGISCGLFEKGKATNLLQDSIDPYSRLDPATILPEQLDSQCAMYPDWGAVRVFRLRGFRLQLTLKDAVFVPELSSRGGKSVKLVGLIAHAEQDPSATAPVAEPPRYAYWGFLGRGHSCRELIPAPR